MRVELMANKTMHHVVIGGDTYEIVDQYAREHGGGGGSGPSPYTSAPAALGTASPGSSALYSRGDHVHPLPAAATTSAAGLMSAQDKGRLDDLYADYSSALAALG